MAMVSGPSTGPDQPKIHIKIGSECKIVAKSTKTTLDSNFGKQFEGEAFVYGFGTRTLLNKTKVAKLNMIFRVNAKRF